MKKEDRKFEDLVERVLALPNGERRKLIALAGPPGSGKSTLARRLASRLSARGRAAQVVPMDGFHLDNRILRDRDHLLRKGSPGTFDLAGFTDLVARLHKREEIFFPIFDRRRDIAISGAGVASKDCDIIVVEGNYLLLNEPGWQDLARQWDLAVWLNVALPELRARAVRRWLKFGFSQQQARERAEKNDLPNAQRVMAAVSRHDIDI